jgi:hypothetical protein
MGQAAVAYTDAQGRFHLQPLRPGRYLISVGPPGGLYASSPWPEVEVGEVEAGRLDLRVALTRGLAIAGQVRGADGHPYARPLLVEALGLTEHGDHDYSRRRRVLLEEGGRFRVEGLLPGRYDLSFEPNAATAEGAETEGALASAEVRRGIEAGTEDLVVDLGVGAVIHGRVVDPDGNPIGAQGALYLFPPGVAVGGQGTLIVGVAPDGRFRSAGLDPSTPYRVLASGFPGFLQASLEGVRPGDAEVRITLARAGAIRGRVVDASGQAVPFGVPVSARALDAPPGTPGSGWVGYTTAGGAFELEALGPHSFSLVAGGGESAYLCAEAVSGVRVGTEGVVLRVTLGVEISGRLLDADGAPVRTSYLAAYGVAAVGGLPSSTHIAGDDGRFTLRGLPRGTVRLRARIGGEYLDLGAVEAPATDLEVRLPR